MFRYERKFLITNYSFGDVEQIIKFHPACFSELFYERQVNNIYFDSSGLSHYYDNVEGSPNRFKVRIRWYGNLFGKIEKPVLEYKIKNGLLGHKESYPLNPFSLTKDFDRKEIVESIANSNISKSVKNEMTSLYPTLLNSYSRKYYLSGDKNYRLTVDHKLNYFRISYLGNKFLTKSTDFNSVILELKYDTDMEEDVKLVTSQFPFSITKSSKYLQGLERVFL